MVKPCRGIGFGGATQSSRCCGTPPLGGGSAAFTTCVHSPGSHFPQWMKDVLEHMATEGASSAFLSRDRGEDPNIIGIHERSHQSDELMQGECRGQADANPACSLSDLGSWLLASSGDPLPMFLWIRCCRRFNPRPAPLCLSVHLR